MHRKLLPLALMYANDKEPIEGRTRLQKMVFLMQQRLEERGDEPLKSHEYEFFAYDYGPFSKQLYDDLDTLMDQEFIEGEEEELSSGNVKYDYHLKSDGSEFVEHQQGTDDARTILELAQEIKTQYNDMLLSDLIDEVYSEYPEYAENSVY